MIFMKKQEQQSRSTETKALNDLSAQPSTNYGALVSKKFSTRPSTQLIEYSGSKIHYFENVVSD